MWADGNKDKGYIFRGQEKDWPLKTSFHRQGRSDLIWYQHNDYKQIKEYIINEEKQFLDAESNPISFYGLLSKAQHHGFPTPLLDWAKSPYVASFFAFEQVTSKQESNKEECVFVYFFDVNLWKEKKIRNDRITMLDPRLFLEVIELPSTFNQRAAAQQSVFMLTNVEHVDSWLGRYGVLKKIGIKLNQRKEVMQDLEAMGITRKSLFPGLDGMCAFLKEREFRYCNEIQ